MARSSKLKVFRTPIGFHDAYVAAPSQKAAMEAWGSDKDLFARGEAELVTDPALTAAPLATPGVIVKRLRGTAAEQIAALPPDRPRRAKAAPVADEVVDTPEKPAAAKRPPKRPPRPARTMLDAAEEAVAAARARQAEERRALAEREAALARERRALDKEQAEEMARLKRARDTAEADFDTALRAWQG
ncbi:MAG: hypothetical protein JWM75_759 [Sphingomonas bacterium]|nr:hypothetical protein [Sphingomonas bacterium]